METFKALPVLLFEDKTEWQAWLAENHSGSRGLWLKLAKKSSGKASVSYSEALEYALCYGWIDSQKEAYDQNFYLQKFTPRGPKSIWSKVNVTKAEELIRSGMMQAAGLAAVDAARHDGRWDDAYEPASASKIPEDFLSELDKNPRALEFFKTLDKANVYAFSWRIQTARKPETRAARIQKFIDLLNRGEKLH